MNIEQAIKWAERMADDRGYADHLAHGGKGDPDEEEAILCARIALSALREKAEREKGCVWCKEDNKVFHDGQHFNMFCSYCGKRLKVNNG